MAIKRNLTTKKNIDDSIIGRQLRGREGQKSQTIYSIKLFQGYGAFYVHIMFVMFKS
jgi:hypothetical protein